MFYAYYFQTRSRDTTHWVKNSIMFSNKCLEECCLIKFQGFTRISNLILWSACNAYYPPIDLHLIIEKSSLKNQVRIMNLIFFSSLNLIVLLPVPLSICTSFLQFSILKYQVWPTWFIQTAIFSLFQTCTLQAGRKIQLKLGKRSSSSNPIFPTGELQKSSADR